MSVFQKAQFARAERRENWIDFVCRHFALQFDFACELAELGALYRNQRRWTPHFGSEVEPNDVIRLHPEPRRFALNSLDLRQILFQDDDFVLIWKPHRIPSHETLDNRKENAKAWLQNQIARPLWSLNRLDIGTRGLLLFATSAAAAQEFHTLLQSQQVEKSYVTLSPCPSRPPGKWIHWMSKSERAPKVVSDSRRFENDLKCELEVFSQTPRNEGIFESHLKLVTGRTHQIRAQFAFEQAPLLGDRLYQSQKFPRFAEKFALSCESLAFQWGGRKLEFERPAWVEKLNQNEDWNQIETESSSSRPSQLGSAVCVEPQSN